MSLEAMQKEIQNQAKELPGFAAKLRELPPFNFPPSRLIFAGSGDSYAASVFAQQLTGGEARAYDPAELFTQAESAKAKVAVLVSVSGRTKANIRLGRRLKGIATKTVAVTADPRSPLAALCDDVIELQYTKSETLTSGTISFTTTILASSYLVGKLPHSLKLTGRIEKMAEAVQRVRADGSFYFLGSGVNKALAEYGASKVHEVLGTKAVALFPEQLGHAELFSIDRERDTVVAVQTGSMALQRLVNALNGRGFRTLSVNSQSRNVIFRSLEVCFGLQRFVLALAKGSGMRECAFLSDVTRLRLSNELIY